MLKYRIQNSVMRRIFEELARYGSVRVKNPSKGLIISVRKLEKRLNSLGFHFSVYYDNYKKELFIHSLSVKEVNKSYALFSRWI